MITEILSSAVLVLIGAGLLVRIAAQSLEQALFSTLIKHRLKRGRRRKTHSNS
jgi:hypothetical protein